MLISFAGVAQSVEQLIRNQQVSGSSPLTSSMSSRALYRSRRFFYGLVFVPSKGIMASPLFTPLLTADFLRRLLNFLFTETAENGMINLKNVYSMMNPFFRW